MAEAAFPESRFAPPENLQAKYWETVHAGYEKMRERSVAICGLARDVGEVLPLTMRRMERLGGLFRQYQVVIYENDSQDDTLAKLEAWQARNPRVRVVAEQRDDPVNPTKRCLARAARMAYYRNQCQQYIKKHFGDCDEVILVDTDLRGGWSDDGIANTYGHDGWDFVGSYGIIYKRLGSQPNVPLQYDAWAYRDFGSDEPLQTMDVNYRRWQRGEPFVRVNSCFGGLGIYDSQAYFSGLYDGSDTEHVPFHRRLREQGYDRLFLNPSQLTLYGRKNRRLDAWYRLSVPAMHWLRQRTPEPWYG